MLQLGHIINYNFNKNYLILKHFKRLLIIGNRGNDHSIVLTKYLYKLLGKSAVKYYDPKYSIYNLIHTEYHKNLEFLLDENKKDIKQIQKRYIEEFEIEGETYKEELITKSYFTNLKKHLYEYKPNYIINFTNPTDYYSITSEFKPEFDERTCTYNNIMSYYHESKPENLREYTLYNFELTNILKQYVNDINNSFANNTNNKQKIKSIDVLTSNLNNELEQLNVNEFILPNITLINVTNFKTSINNKSNFDYTNNIKTNANFNNDSLRQLGYSTYINLCEYLTLEVNKNIEFNRAKSNNEEGIKQIEFKYTTINTPYLCFTSNSYNNLFKNDFDFANLIHSAYKSYYDKNQRNYCVYPQISNTSDSSLFNSVFESLKSIDTSNKELLNITKDGVNNIIQIKVNKDSNTQILLEKEFNIIIDNILNHNINKFHKKQYDVFSTSLSNEDIYITISKFLGTFTKLIKSVCSSKDFEEINIFIQEIEKNIKNPDNTSLIPQNPRHDNSKKKKQKEKEAELKLIKDSQKSVLKSSQKIIFEIKGKSNTINLNYDFSSLNKLKSEIDDNSFPYNRKMFEDRYIEDSFNIDNSLLTIDKLEKRRKLMKKNLI